MACSSLILLPPELLCQIFYHLVTPTKGSSILKLYQSGRVCKIWNATLRTEFLWKNIHKSRTWKFEAKKTEIKDWYNFVRARYFLDKWLSDRKRWYSRLQYYISTCPDISGLVCYLLNKSCSRELTENLCSILDWVLEAAKHSNRLELIKLYIRTYIRYCLKNIRTPRTNHSKSISDYRILRMGEHALPVLAKERKNYRIAERYLILQNIDAIGQSLEPWNLPIVLEILMNVLDEKDNDSERQHAAEILGKLASKLPQGNLHREHVYIHLRRILENKKENPNVWYGAIMGMLRLKEKRALSLFEQMIRLPERGFVLPIDVGGSQVSVLLYERLRLAIEELEEITW